MDHEEVGLLPLISPAGHIDEVVKAVYGELRRLARVHLSRLAPGQSIQATELVHEAYLRMMGNGRGGRHGSRVASVANTREFFFIASRAMHDILVERARRRSRLKRGGGRRRVEMDKLVLADDVPAHDMLALEESLQTLRRESPEKYQLVLLRFFGGLSAGETAELLGASLRTVERQWRYVRARLHRELSSD